MVLEAIFFKTSFKIFCFAILIRRKVTTIGFWNQTNTKICGIGCVLLWFFKTQIETFEFCSK
jgi:hypothetical protein